MITTGIISGFDGDRVEHEYCYVYPNRYVCIDANFFLVNGTAKNMEHSVCLTAFRLLSLNPSCTLNDIGVYLCDRLNQIVSSGNQVRLTEAMIWSFVGSCTDDAFERYRGNISVSKYVYWKLDLSGLLSLKNEEIVYLSSFSDLEYNERKAKLLSMKKQKYGLDMVAKTKRSDKVSLIYNAMLAIRETDQPVTIGNISRLTKIPESTISNYIREFSDFTDEIEFVDGRSLVKEKNLHILENAIVEMRQKGMSVTKTELHRYTGVSRPTINKYWGKLLIKIM